jgi:hypothetical protein
MTKKSLLIAGLALAALTSPYAHIGESTREQIEKEFVTGADHKGVANVRDYVDGNALETVAFNDNGIFRLKMQI